MTSDASQRRIFINGMAELDAADAEEAAIKARKRDIFAVFKDAGLNPKAIRAYRRELGADPEKQAALDSDLDTYRAWWENRKEEAPHAHARARDAREAEEEPTDGPRRQGWRARAEILAQMEADGVIDGTDTGKTVYFVHAPKARLVKIGVSDQLKARLADLSSMSPVPLKLLGTTTGGVKREIELHKQFADYRDHGEWFRAEQALLDAIKEIIASPVHPGESMDPETGEITETENGGHPQGQALNTLPGGDAETRPVVESPHACGDGAVQGRCEPTAPLESHAKAEASAPKDPEGPEAAGHSASRPSRDGGFPAAGASEGITANVSEGVTAGRDRQPLDTRPQYFDPGPPPASIDPRNRVAAE